MQVDFSDLSAYLDGELRDSEKCRAVEAQIAGSPVYAAEYERIRGAQSLMTAHVVQPGFHRQLMERAHAYDQRASWDGPLMRWLWRGAAMAATVTVAAFVADYTGLINRVSGPTASNTVTLNGASNTIPSATGTGAAGVAASEQDTTSDGPAPGRTHQPTAAVPLALISTAGGAAKTAVIERTDTSKSQTYRIGDTIMPGVKLADVRYGQVVLEFDGTRHILAASGVLDESMAGRWAFRTTGTDGEPLIAHIVEREDMVYLTTESGEPIATGVRTGSHVAILMPTDRGRVRVEGDIRGDTDEIVLTGVMPTGNPDKPNFRLDVRARRLDATPHD